MIPLSAAFFIFLAIGVPISIAIALASALGLVVMDFPLRGVPARMFSGIDSFLLIAAPFYILTGELMGRSQITGKLIRLSMLVTQFARAGTAYAVVVASTLFSGISGTAVGDAAALGQIFIREMQKEGYTTRYSAGLIASASILGPIIPPSVIMVIYGAIARLSILDLFIAGLVPGLLIALSLAITIWLGARKGTMPKPQFRSDGQPVWRIVVDGILVLSLPLVVIRGAVTGVFTTTEAGGIAVVYALFLGMVVFRTLTIRGVWESLKVTGAITASVYLILATSEVMSYAFTLAGFDSVVQGFGDHFVGHPTLFMFAIVAVFTLIGTFLEPGPAVILFIPLLLPAVEALNVDPLQFAMVALLTLNIGLITPPVGIVMFVVGRIARIDIWELFRGIWPFFIAETLVIVLLCIFPVLSSGLPHLLRHTP